MHRNKPMSVTSDVAESDDRAPLTRERDDSATSSSDDLCVVIPSRSLVLAPGVTNSANISIKYRIRVSSEAQRASSFDGVAFVASSNPQLQSLGVGVGKERRKLTFYTNKGDFLLK